MFLSYSGDAIEICNCVKTCMQCASAGLTVLLTSETAILFQEMIPPEIAISYFIVFHIKSQFALNNRIHVGTLYRTTDKPCNFNCISHIAQKYFVHYIQVPGLNCGFLAEMAEGPPLCYLRI